MKNRIIKCFEEVAEYYRKLGIEFIVLLKEDQRIAIAEFDFDYDIRLNFETFIDNSITIISKKNNMFLYKTTFFLIEKDSPIQDFYYFWELNNNDLTLEKVKLSRITNKTNCCITGYTQVSNHLVALNNISATPLMMRFYIELCKQVLKEGIPILMEPCGICEFEGVRVQEKNKIVIHEKEVVKSFGKVNKNSRVSEKTALLLKLKKIPNVFHCTTLGPVYYSENL